MQSIGSILLTAVLASATLLAQAPQTPPTGSGLIVGQIVDAGTGSPIGGAVAVISGPPLASSAGPPRIQVLTGGDGRFVFRDLPKGTYTITATKGGYLPGGYGRRRPEGPTQSIELADGERAGVISLPMWKHGVITGTVVDETGEPVIGVQVRVMRRTALSGTRRFTLGLAGSTDDRGMYRVAGLIPGDYLVVIPSTQVAVPASALDEYRQAMTSNDPARSTLMQTLLELGSAGPLGGPGTSLPIGDQVQTLRGATPPPPPAEGARLFAYPTTFHPGATASAQAAIITLGSGQETTGVDLQLRPVPMYRVTGVVMGPDGPASTIAVRLVQADADGSPSEIDSATTVTDRNGLFTVLGVPPGSYMLRVTKTPRPATQPGSMTTVQMGGGTMIGTFSEAPAGPPAIPADPTLWAAMPVNVGRADISGLTVSLRTGLRISGRVEFDGSAEKPPAQMMMRLPITIEPIEGRPTPPIQPGRIDPATSQFNSYGLPGGRYFVRAGGAPPGWTFKSATYQGQDISDVPLDLESSDATGVVIAFTDRPTELSGTAQTARGGDPDATIIVFPADSTSWLNAGPNPRRVRNVRSGPTGAYKIAGLPPGTYYVAAVADEFAGDWRDPKFLETLARSASQVTLDEGQKKSMDVRTTQVR